MEVPRGVVAKVLVWRGWVNAYIYLILSYVKYTQLVSNITTQRKIFKILHWLIFKPFPTNLAKNSTTKMFNKLSLYCVKFVFIETVFLLELRLDIFFFLFSSFFFFFLVLSFCVFSFFLFCFTDFSCSLHCY